VPANISYQEWYDKHIANNPEALVIEKSIKNIYADTKQFEKYKNLLGKDAPKTLDEMQRLKYTNSNGWDDFKAFASYKKKYPESNKQYYNINKEIQSYVEKGIINKRIGVAVKPNKIIINVPDEHALDRMSQRGFNMVNAQSYVNNSIVAFSQANNEKIAFYADSGVSVVIKENQILKTGWSSEYNDYSAKLILEVTHKNGI